MSTPQANEPALTFSQLVGFFRTYIEPQFQDIRGDIKKIYIKLNEHDGRFDDLYKKFEDIHQEMAVSNHQIKRLTFSFETIRDAVADLHLRLKEIH